MWCGTRARPISVSVVGVEDEQARRSALGLEDDAEQDAVGLLGRARAADDTGSPG